MKYHCDNCGCYLDPGEGRVCDECLERAESQEISMIDGIERVPPKELDRIKRNGVYNR